MNTLPIEILRERFTLLDDGTLVWNWSGKKAGTISGRGYVYINIGKKLYKAHRIVWAMTHGEWPEQHLDHINGIRTDNRPSNLRLATPAQNSYNMKSKSERLKGVFPAKSRVNPFFAAIRANGKNHYLGVFKTQEEAHAAYRKASEEMHGAFGRPA